MEMEGAMAEPFWNRAKAERGFTLIDLLIVLILIGILLAIITPAYMKFAGRAHDAAASANIRAALPAVAAFKADNDSTGGYTSMTIGGPAGLKSYDSSLVAWDAAKGKGVTVLSTAAETYCIKSVSGGATYYQSGPAQPIATSPACS
jgi:prepilin-type N-terminal cleavage/methylation domain-containing protein